MCLPAKKGVESSDVSDIDVNLDDADGTVDARGTIAVQAHLRPRAR